MITDAQVHLYEVDTPERPWPRDADRVGAPAKHAASFTAEEMIGSMDAIGVDRAVVVPPVWAGEDNGYALSAATRYEGRFAVMGRLDPYAPDSPERLEHWLEHPHMRGIRMSGRWYTTPTGVDAALGDPQLEWYWAACERLGIPIALLTRRFSTDVARIAERHPDLALLIDHLGTGDSHVPTERFASLDDLIALARFPRMYVKLGTAPARSDQAFPFADVHPYLRRMHQAFGAQRMLWEADITQLTKQNTYAECLRLWQEGLPFLSGDDRDWILGRTAAEVLQWREATA